MVYGFSQQKIFLLSRIRPLFQAEKRSWPSPIPSFSIVCLYVLIPALDDLSLATAENLLEVMRNNRRRSLKLQSFESGYHNGNETVADDSLVLVNQNVKMAIVGEP